MSVLSDASIREYMSNDQLILDGSPDRAKGCAYEFRPGLVVKTGVDDASKCQMDWTGAVRSSDVHWVQPGEMVWIRALERVALPPDICAYWAQTNRFSRQGLMLVNMSMVMPGHVGNIACLFVNFGKRPIRITPKATVAKLVFLRLDTRASRQIPPQPSTLDYDIEVVATAMDAPTSFLSLAELAIGLQDEERKAINALRDAKEQQLASLREAAEQTAHQVSREMSDDLSKSFRRALGPAAIGFVLIILASSFVPWIQSQIQPDLPSEVQRIVRDAVSNQSGLSSVEERLRVAERQLQDIQRQSGSNPSAPTSTSTSRP